MNKPALPPSIEDISYCAKLIWEVEGRPEGRDMVHWCQAEDQLMACHAYDHWMFPSSVLE